MPRLCTCQWTITHQTISRAWHRVTSFIKTNSLPLSQTASSHVGDYTDDHHICHLEPVQNAAARLIFRLRRSDDISDVLICLHWLRVPERIVFIVQGRSVQTYWALDPTKTPVFHLGRSVCSCCQTAYCWTLCFLCRWRSCLEHSSCRCHTAPSLFTIRNV